MNSEENNGADFLLHGWSEYNFDQGFVQMHVTGDNLDG